MRDRRLLGLLSRSKPAEIMLNDTAAKNNMFRAESVLYKTSLSMQTTPSEIILRIPSPKIPRQRE